MPVLKDYTYRSVGFGLLDHSRDFDFRLEKKKQKNVFRVFLNRGRP